MRAFATLSMLLVASSLARVAVAAPRAVAQAADAPEVVVPTPAAGQAATPTPIADAASWSASYERAKRQMLAGRFAEAAAAFAVLAASAPDEGRRLLATEQAAVCQVWAAGGFALVSGSSEEAQEMRAARTDHRTTGELATLYTAAVLYGVGSGLALAVGTKPGNSAGVILPSLLFAGGAAGIVALLDHQTQLRYGVPQSIVSGMLIGLEEAIAWSGWNQARSLSSDEWSAGQMAALYWGTATAGALAGGILGSLYGTTPGRASLAGSGALWSAVIAGLATAAFVPDNEKQDDRAFLAAALALNAGGVAAVIAGSSVSPSIARVRFIDLGGISGGLLFGGLYLSTANNHASGQGAAGWLAAGAAAGLGAAWFLTRDMEPDAPRRAQGALSTMVPTLAPAGTGSGMVFGIASVM
jgi:hypothetical protein